MRAHTHTRTDNEFASIEKAWIVRLARTTLAFDASASSIGPFSLVRPLTGSAMCELD